MNARSEDAPGTQVVIVETARLRLRQMSADDAPFMLALLNDPAFVRNIGDRGVRTLDDARIYIAAGPQASYVRFGFGLYIVELKAAGTPIGICGLLKRDTLADVDIGFAFLPAYRQRGYAVESAAAIRDYARDGIGLRRLVAIVNPANDASMRVLQRIGFSYERMIAFGNEGADVKLFAADLS